ncbi:MAG: transrane type protein [Chloroflexota bacterium]|nr:transrane type protein [Chloroflexota bacterium]
MVKYLLGRLATAIPTLLAVLFITFTLTYVSPYDPVRQMLANAPVQNMDTDENIARIKHQYGLDRPFLVQFWDYLVKLSQGYMGISINGQRDVGTMIAKTLPVSAQLGLAAAFLTAALGIPLGALAALRQNSWVDYLIISTTLIFRSLPVYVLAPLMLVLLVLVLHVMKVPRGWHGILAWQAILPVFLMTLGPLPIVIRQTRQGVLEVLAQDYVRTARAKGLSTRAIIVRHVLRNALIPVITSFGFITEGLIVSTVFIDSIFAIPGYGSVAGSAFGSFDYPVILGVTLVGSTLVIGANVIVDLVYPLLDPRVTLS